MQIIILKTARVQVVQMVNSASSVGSPRLVRVAQAPATALPTTLVPSLTQHQALAIVALDTFHHTSTMELEVIMDCRVASAISIAIVTRARKYVCVALVTLLGMAMPSTTPLAADAIPVIPSI
jgi:hypothetical protein